MPYFSGGKNADFFERRGLVSLDRGVVGDNFFINRYPIIFMEGFLSQFDIVILGILLGGWLQLTVLHDQHRELRFEELDPFGLMEKHHRQSPQNVNSTYYLYGVSPPAKLKAWILTQISR